MTNEELNESLATRVLVVLGLGCVVGDDLEANFVTTLADCPCVEGVMENEAN
jgi:glycerol uptake facilitator-like aquaporin